MIKKVIETKELITLIFGTPLDESFGGDPKIRASKVFFADLLGYLNKKFTLKLEKPTQVDMNFAHYLEMKEVFTVDSKGMTRWEYEAALEIQKQTPDKIDK